MSETTNTAPQYPYLPQPPPAPKKKHTWRSDSGATLTEKYGRQQWEVPS